MSDISYSCSLSEASIQKAKEELHEDPDERLGAMQTLKDWVQREPWITAPTDPLFLLSFLRCGKFSQLSARERLGNFLASFSGYYKFLVDLEPGDPKSLEIIRRGAFILLPEKDREGRGIIISKVDRIDTSGSCSYQDLMRASIPLFHSWLFFDEELQVNGWNFLTDYGGTTMSLMRWAPLESFTEMAAYLNKALPARVKGLNYYNISPVFEAVMTIFKPLLNVKLRERMKELINKHVMNHEMDGFILALLLVPDQSCWPSGGCIVGPATGPIHVHHTMVSVYEQIDKSILPEEYLPDDYKGPCAGKIDDIIENNIKNYLLDAPKRTFLENLYSGKYSADLTKKPKNSADLASYRKLTVS